VAGAVALGVVEGVEGVGGVGKGVGKGRGCRQRTWQRDLTTGPLNLSPAQHSVRSVPLSMSGCWPIMFVEGQFVSGWKHAGVVEGGERSSLANCRFGISLWCFICLTVEGGIYRRLLIVGFVQRQGLERPDWAAQAAFNCQPNCHVLQRRHSSCAWGTKG
jgi:hypothetical protein